MKDDIAHLLQESIIKAPKLPYKLFQGDCLKIMPSSIEKESIHLIITDPPYFLDGLSDSWEKAEKVVRKHNNKTGSVNGLPCGMKFDPKNGLKLQKFIAKCGSEMLQCLKPGGFAFVFSQARLSHRMAVGLEDSGFEIRDILSWQYTKRSQFKAFSLNHFVDKMVITDKEKTAIKNKMNNRKTPQLRTQFESIIMAQKPREGTFINNWLKYETGLIDSTASLLLGKAPTTVMQVEKPVVKHGHLTPKPLKLIEHLVRLGSKKGQIVLDPFLGSGTTILAALNLGRFCIGIEKNKQYVNIAHRRVQEEWSEE